MGIEDKCKLFVSTFLRVGVSSTVRKPTQPIIWHRTLIACCPLKRAVSHQGDCPLERPPEGGAKTCNTVSGLPAMVWDAGQFFKAVFLSVCLTAKL